MTRRIGANLLWLVPGVVGGSEEYTMRLLRAYAEVRSEDIQLVLLVNEQLPDAYRDVVERYETVVAPVDGSRKARRVAIEHTWLAWTARRLRLDLVHHMGGTMPLLRSVPGIVTIHDLQPFAMPEHFTRIKRAYLRVVLPTSARRARRVMTLTEFTRGDLQRRLGIDPDRITVIPSGVSVRAPDEELARLPDALARYGLTGRRYVLYPAITYPHKNHAVLLEALAALGPSHADTALVLTGGAARMEQQLATRARQLGIERNVVRTGRIPREDLDALYRGATALVFPSKFEGFGLPVLEAMARDCPVIASDATALPEVVDDAGMLVPPDDPGAWSSAIATLLDDPSARVRLIDAGRRRAAHYDWATAATELERGYRDVLESGP